MVARVRKVLILPVENKLLCHSRRPVRSFVYLFVEKRNDCLIFPESLKQRDLLVLSSLAC